MESLLPALVLAAPAVVALFVWAVGRRRRRILPNDFDFTHYKRIEQK